MAHPHLIYRQMLEISFPSKKKAIDGQETISQLYRQDLMPLINEIFDGVCNTSKHVRIDRLEIDLGAISSHNLKEDFKQELRKQLEDELLKDVQQAHHFAEQSNGRADASAQKGGWSKEPTVHSSDHSTLDLFEFFLKTGQLPWWSGKEQTPSLDDLALTLIDNQPERLLDLLSKLMGSGSYSRRLIHQFSDHILMRFIELKSSGTGVGEQIKHLHEDFYRLHRHKQLIPLNHSNFRLLLWQSAFRFWLLSDGTPSSTLDVVTSDDWKLEPASDIESDRIDENVLRLSPVAPTNELQSYLLFVIKVFAKKIGRGVKSEISQTYQNREQQMTHQLLQRVVDLRIQDQSLGKMITVLVNLPSSNLGKVFETKSLDQIKKITEDGEEEANQTETNLLPAEDRIEIENAGLVIIAPFLPKFFDALGLVNEKAFATDEAAERAALLLQYIATGETDIPEYELVLNKILCGLSIDEPLPRKLEISDPERKEVENLLASVIEHWEALKNTSVEGLQQTFLIKDGLLSAAENGWTLRVERTTVDVLLDRLPWSISLIKLPWNNDILHVEW